MQPVNENSERRPHLWWQRSMVAKPPQPKPKKPTRRELEARLLAAETRIIEMEAELASRAAG